MSQILENFFEQAKGYKKNKDNNFQLKIFEFSLNYKLTDTKGNFALTNLGLQRKRLLQAQKAI